MAARLPLLAAGAARTPAAAAIHLQLPGASRRLLQLRHGRLMHCYDTRQQRRTASAAAPAARTGAGAASPELAAVPLSAAATEAHKKMNARVVAAAEASPAQLLELVEAELPAFNVVNATTAFHRLAKCAAALPPAQRGALRAHPQVRRLAASLAGCAGAMGDLQVSQALWAHAQLGHAPPALLDALYARLATARVLAAGVEDDSSSSSSDGSGGQAPALVLANTGAACNLVWAQARLRRPQPELLQRLVEALLAAEAAAAGQQQQQRRHRQGSAGAAAAGPSSSSSSSSRPEGVSLAGCDGRALCLLAWSLASLGACPPELLGAVTSAVRARPGGLAALGLHSLCNLLTAHAMVVEAQAGSLPCDQQLADEAAAALAAGGAQHGRERAQRRGQQGQQPGQLNEADCSILVRCLAAAWQEAAVASGADTGNRLKLSAAVKRHVAALPARGAAARVLAASTLRLAPRLSVRALSALAHAFASMGGAPPALLDALAARAVALQGQLDVAAVANLGWAFSTLQHDHPQLFESLAGAALRLLREHPADAAQADAGGDLGSSTDAIAAGSSSDGAGAINSPSSGAASDSNGAASGMSSSSGGGDGSRQAFTAQAVSVVALSFAAANRCDSPAQRQVMRALAERAEALLPCLTPQGLANLAWALTVAGLYPPALVRRWRTVAGGAAAAFTAPELHQLHLVEVALRLEAPEIGLDIPPQARSFFDSLYQAGRLRAFAGRAWARHQQEDPRSVSDFQLQVYRTMRALGVPCALEHSEAGEYSIDVAIPSRRIAVEVDGPVHFATNSRHLMGGTALKRRLLQRLGWRVVAVPFFDWWQLAPGQRQRYMRAKLSAAGLDPSTFAQAAPAPPVPAPAAAAVVETEQQRQQEQPHASEPALQQPAIAGESAAAVQQGDGGGSAATPAGLAQRAQRLSLLQHRQGKLSRQGLLTKTARSALAASGPTGKAGSDGSGASNVGSEAAPGSGGAAEHEGSGGAPAS